MTAKALWDTGATVICINQKVVDTLNLKPHREGSVSSVGGVDKRYTYLIDFRLPNMSYVRNVEAFCVFLDRADMIVGMDVITLGDFAITNVDGKTTFSFRTPSQETIDYGDTKTELDKFCDEHSLSDEELWKIVQEYRSRK